MKKVLAILLCIVMMLSMAACGGNQDNGGNLNNDQGNAGVPNGNEQLKGEPTDEEKNAIGCYSEAVDALEKFAETGSWANLSFDCQKFGVEYEGDNYIIEGTAAAQKYYELIESLDVVDKWVGSEYLSQFAGNWDRQAVLDSFVIYKDVKLSENYTVYDPVGNTENLAINWYYDADGKLVEVRWDSEIGEKYPYSFVFDPIEIDPLHLMVQEYDHRAEPVYGADGKITEVKVIGGGETMFLSKLTYGSNGKVSVATVTAADGNNGTLTYSYDSQDRLTEVSFQSDNDMWGYVYYATEGSSELRYGSKKFTYAYTYNADGKVAKKEYLGYTLYDELDHSVVTEYSYDAAGNLAGAISKRDYVMAPVTHSDKTTSFTDNYVFTCNAQGTPVSATITSSDITYNNSYTEPSENPKIEVECVYGDLYVYSPAK